MAQQAPIIEFRRRGFPAPIAVTRAEVTRSHGIAPSAISLDIVPLDIEELQTGGRIGDLYIEYEGQSLTIPDCIIDSTSFHADVSNRVTSLILFDRRWRWQFGEISGHYNRYNEAGEVIASEEADIRRTEANSERTPQVLGLALLQKMNEPDADFGALPTDTRPEFEWDHDLPARQLDALCELYGCRVVLPWSNVVEIWKEGQRRGLRPDQLSRVPRIRRLQELTDFYLPPGLPIIRAATSLNVAERPDRIEISSSPILYQFDMRLEAVGEDTDGEIKLLRDLSYSPDRTDQYGGWYAKDMVAPGTDIHMRDADDDVKHLASKCVGKWFRVKVPFTFPGRVKNPEREEGEEEERERPIRIERLTQILPIYPFRASTTTQNQITVQQEAIVYGSWFDGWENTQSGNLESLDDELDGTERPIIPGGYQIVGSKGLVVFRDPVVLAGGDGKYLPPDLVLRACFNYRLNNGSYNTGVFSREQPEPQLGTQALTVKRLELLISQRVTYRAGTFIRPIVVDNVRDVQTVANQYIDEIELAYQNRQPLEVVYAGFYPQIDLDGKIRTISFSIDANNRSAPITTSVYLDQDIAGFGNLSYVELKNAARIRDMSIRSRISTSVVQRRRFERNERF